MFALYNKLEYEFQANTAHGSFENITTLLILKYDYIAIMCVRASVVITVWMLLFPEQDDAKYYQNQ
jgi:hypothetical protein